MSLRQCITVGGLKWPIAETLQRKGNNIGHLEFECHRRNVDLVRIIQIIDALTADHCVVNTLVFDNCRIEEKLAETIASRLEHKDNRVTHLRLDHCEIKTGDLREIISCLGHEDCKVTKLTIRRTFVSPNVIDELIAMLKGRRTKLALRLERCRVSEKDMDLIREANTC